MMKKFKLNIQEKNLLYNLILTLLICGLIFSYMIFYMPKVYMEKKMKRVEENALEVHNSYIENKNYEKLSDLPKEGMYSFFIPRGSDRINLSGLHVNSDIDIKNDHLKNLVRYIERVNIHEFDQEEFTSLMMPIKEDLKDGMGNFADLDFQQIDREKTEGDISFKVIGSTVEVKFESKTEDTIATNLVLVTKNDEGTFVLVYPFIFETIDDIKSTVLSAFPVIFLVVIFIVFLLNRYYSKSITDPILAISNFTKKSRNQKGVKYDLEIHTNDEIEDLSNNLKDLYETLTESYSELEKSTKRREIFIKSTSHELKTPLQTAILLNESMIGKIGTYSNTEKYLPELRKKLFQIQALIDDLLYMNRIDESPNFEDLDLSLILRESIDHHMDLIVQKNLDVSVEGERVDYVDYDHFRIIFDNLIKNAIENTEKNGRITCHFNDLITIENTPTHMNVKEVNALLDPFVSGKEKKSNGMGLYIAKTLLEDMNYRINLSYEDGKFVVLMKKGKQAGSTKM